MAHRMASLTRRLLPAPLWDFVRGLRNAGNGARAHYAALRLGAASGQVVAARDLGDVRSVLFVCAGNLMRSPFAEVLARRRAAELGLATEFRSAGGLAEVGHRAAAAAQTAAERFGVSLREHRATPLDGALVVWADLILAMDYMNMAQLFARHSSARGKTQLLMAVMGQHRTEVADPYGTDPQEVRRVFAHIATAIDGLVTRLARRRPSRLLGS